MSIVEKQVARARARLTTNVLLERAAQGLLVAAGLWALVWIVERMFVFGLPLWPSAAAAAGLAAVITVVGTILSRVDRVQAAVAIDQSAGLKERLSTAMTCGAQSARDPFAHAAVSDAERVAAKIHVPTHLPYRAPRLWPWSMATVLTAVLIGLFLQPLHLFANVDPADPEKLRKDREEKRQLTIEVNKRLNKINEMARNNPRLNDIASDPEALKMPDEPLETPDDVRREALKRIEKIADKFGNKRDSDEMNALKEMKRMLAKLNPQQGKDPGSKLSQALASGDFQKAKRALDEMKELMDKAAKSSDPKDRQAAAEMKKRLDTLAAKLYKAGDQKQLQKDLEKKAGMSAEDAKKLLEQLAKMDPKAMQKELQKRLGDSGMSQQQIKKMAQKMAANKQAQQALKSLGQSLAQCAGAMQQEDGSSSSGGGSSLGSSAMADAAGQLSNMEMAQQMMNELEASLAELDDLRDSVCEGTGPGMKPSDKIGNQGPQYGRAYGSRIGKERAAHSYKPTKVKAQIRGGQIIAQMYIDGPQIKGEALAEATEALNASERDVTDPIDRDDVPRQYERVTREYFERLANVIGKKVKPKSESKPDPNPKAKNLP